MKLNNRVYYTLRIAAGLCFIGHGAFGIITKVIWLNYFAVFGIGKVLASQLMPWLGGVDILFGLSLLFYPTRAVLLWLVIWGTLTAMLRPLSGEPFPEFIERAGNYGAPFVLLIFYGLKGKKWFEPVMPGIVTDEKTLDIAMICLKIVVFLLLAGHGWLNLIGKKGLLSQYASLGFSYPLTVAHIAGILEIVSACLVLIKPLRPLLMILLIWKTGTELFYPHWEVFEWIERGGSYGSILALYFMLPQTSFQSRGKVTSLNSVHLS